MFPFRSGNTVSLNAKFKSQPFEIKEFLFPSETILSIVMWKSDADPGNSVLM